MNTVIFRTEEAIFQFDHCEVIEHLEREISDNSLAEDKKHFELLLNSTEDVIEINSAVSSFGYLALDLIEQGIGQVTCEVCNRTYNSNELYPTISMPFSIALFDLGPPKISNGTEENEDGTIPIPADDNGTVEETDPS